MPGHVRAHADAANLRLVGNDAAEEVCLPTHLVLAVDVNHVTLIGDCLFDVGVAADRTQLRELAHNGVIIDQLRR